MQVRQKGFTLLEMLIVIGIMATLMMFSSSAIKNAIQSKVKLETQVSDFSTIRDTLKIMERDINLAFHYIDIETELRDKIRTERKTLISGGPATPGGTGTSTTSTTTTTLPGEIPGQQTAQNPALQGLDANGCFGEQDPLCVKPTNRVDPTTQFVGKENELALITMNAGRIRETNPQADFIKVGYSLRSCRRPGEEGKGSNCLLRRSSNVAEGDIAKGGEEVVLLQNISEFKLRYLGKGKQDWVTDWNSIQGDAATKGKFPEAVEISLTVEKGESEKKKKISMQIIAAVRFPNNPEQKPEQKKPTP